MMMPTQEELHCLVHNDSLSRLVCLNNVKARLYLPVTVFLSVLIVVGTLGNATVCLVYWRRRSSRVSSNYFILSLAVLDLVTCVVGMPTEIADLLLPYTFQWPLACKILRFTHSSTIIASSTILIEVAFDRYYRICHLGRQFTAAKAKLLCLGAAFLGVICSWPTFILFGRKTVTRDLDGVLVIGSDCSTADGMRQTIFPTVYYLFLFSLFGLTVTFFAVLYSQIGLAVLHRKRVTVGSVASSSSATRNNQQQAKEDGVDESDEAEIDALAKIRVNVVDASSSEMSSGHHHDACSHSDDPNYSYHKWSAEKVKDAEMGRSVSASTILSSLAGSLRRPGKRRSPVPSGHTRWYTIEPSPAEDQNKARESSASMEDCLGSGDKKSATHGDILNRAASLNKVISESHCTNVENYRNACLTHRTSSLNKYLCSGSNKHYTLDCKSHSDKEGIYPGNGSHIEEGLLESLQKFNFDFNRTFNIRSDDEVENELKDNAKTIKRNECPLAKQTELNDADKQSENHEANTSSDNEDTGNPLSSSLLAGAQTFSTNTNIPEVDCEKSQFNKEKCEATEDMRRLNNGPRPINGCSKQFLNRLNMYVSNSCPTQQLSESKFAHSCGLKLSQRSQEQAIFQQSPVKQNVLELCETNKSAQDQIPLKDGEHQQREEQNNHYQQQQQQQRPMQALSPSAFTRKVSAAFLKPERKMSVVRHAQRQVRVGKTTTVLFAVTLAYILSFLPYLTVMVLRSVVRDLEENLSPVGELAYKLCVKSFFINNAINPIIYSFLNQTFRSDARHMFARWFRAAARKQRMRVRVLPIPPEFPAT